ncbi:MAG: hypothetical protein JW801_19025 [Bacteroidales bacterium]|nr:hypothetical protein [Bacteroidales bacterium]
MRVQNYINQGSILILIGLLHTSLAFSPEGFGYKMSEFAGSGFFRISSGMAELPPAAGKTDFEAFTAFWFFYFGILLIPLGILVFEILRKQKYLPHSFTISYLLFVGLGVYMVPNSGMTFIMLPHALFMLIQNLYKSMRNMRNATTTSRQ